MKQGKIELKNMTYEHEDALGCGPCCARCGNLPVVVLFLCGARRLGG